MMRALAWILVAAIVVLTLAPASLRPVSPLPHKLEHLIAFLLLGIALARAYPHRIYFLALMAILFVGGVEALQLFAPGRHARLSDFVVDAVSVCAGLAMASIRRS